MTHNRKAPICSIIALAAQMVGLVAAYLLMYSLINTEGQFIALMIIVPVYGFCSLVGFICALGSLKRREQWRPLSWFALVFNLIPFLWMLCVAGQKA